MSESFEQKVIRNVQGKFSIFKTPEVIGSSTGIPNIEWDDNNNVDGFFQFAAHLGAKVIYVTEGEDESGQKIMVQVGFLHQGIMHHINFAEDDEDDEDDEDFDEDEEGDEEVVETHEEGEVPY